MRNPRPTVASHRRAWHSLLLGSLLALSSGLPAVADDTEIFVNPNAGAGIRPNLLLILDTSTSMSSVVNVTRLPYDRTQQYDGPCNDDRIYFSVGANAGAPSCSSSNGVDPPEFKAEALKCSVAVESIRVAGFWTGKALQFDEDTAAWSELPVDDNDAPVECDVDAGIHGENDISNRRYAQNGDEDEPWTSREADAIDWRNQVVTLYGANYLNWLYSDDVAGQLTRIDVLRAVAKQLVLSLDNMNVGVMRFSVDQSLEGDARSEGGMVVHEMADVRSSRASILQVIDNLTAEGLTPLSETLYEAGQYWAGRNVDYGLTSRAGTDSPLPSVPASRKPTNNAEYRSPMEFTCQRNYTVLLTDGEPFGDRSSADRVQSLPQYSSAVGAACAGEEGGEGRCLTEMAKYLGNADLSPLPGRQSTQVSTIGFGPEVAGSSLLSEVATAGGGRAYSADNIEGLTEAFQDIVRNVRETASTFTTPAVGINAFNRTQTLNDLYVSVFKPTETLRWPGNLKKYAIQGGRIVDALGADAIDPATGFFRDGSRSLWSAGADGNQAERGGAAEQLPDTGARRLFTYIASAANRNLTATVNAFSVDNSLLTDAVLGVTPDGYTREQIIGWTRGQDVRDSDGDGNLTETVRSLGDPLHARPALVSYGGNLDDPNPRDVLILVPTNDGIIHAIDAATGRELWGFVAPELLGRLSNLVDNPPQTQRTYGLDGDVRVLKFDRNQNGIVEASDGDRVWAYFGMRRGGRQYYALDITDRTRPELKWILGPAQLPDVGETWSTPAIARVRVAGTTQNGENLVLIFGGGYDAGQQNYNFREDNVGNGIYMVDASSGALLWYAGGPGGSGTPDLALDRMRHSIPGRVVTLDIDGDQFADRMYAADMGGRVWRFDIFNGQPRGSLVTGGVFAQLGAPASGAPSREDTRRFYYAPDVALIQRRGADPYYNLAIGSGYRGHPLETDTRDRFYSLRDKQPFSKFTQGQYNTIAPLVESDLIDITNNPSTTAVPTSARGWRFELRLNDGWSGEKVLAESLTVGGVVLFPTYQPQSPSAVDPCSTANGLNRVYALNVDTGKPAIDFSGDRQITDADLSTQLAQTGIAGEVTFAFEAVERPPGNPTGGGQGGGNTGPGGRTVDALGRGAVCVVGVEVLRRCVLPGSVVRTFWQRVGAGP
jgi:type IV pilus assembly protein PilY1